MWAGKGRFAELCLALLQFTCGGKLWCQICWQQLWCQTWDDTAQTAASFPSMVNDIIPCLISLLLRVMPRLDKYSAVCKDCAQVLLLYNVLLQCAIIDCTAADNVFYAKDCMAKVEESQPNAIPTMFKSRKKNDSG